MAERVTNNTRSGWLSTRKAVQVIRSEHSELEHTKWIGIVRRAVVGEVGALITPCSTHRIWRGRVTWSATNNHSKPESLDSKMNLKLLSVLGLREGAGSYVVGLCWLPKAESLQNHWILTPRRSDPIWSFLYLRQLGICLQWERSLFTPWAGKIPLEKVMATHSSIFACRIPWTEEPCRLQSRGSQRIGHKWATNTFTFFHTQKTKESIAWILPLIQSVTLGKNLWSRGFRILLPPKSLLFFLKKTHSGTSLVVTSG